MKKLFVLYEEAERFEFLLSYGHSFRSVCKRFKDEKKDRWLLRGLASLLVIRRNRRLNFHPDHAKERPLLRLIH